MKYTLLFIFLSVAGCNLQSPDYYQIMLSCAERKGYYFSATIPSWLGPRLIAGCVEDKTDLKVKIIQSVNGHYK